MSDDNGRFLTVDCIDVFIDEPGDCTVRPIPPERLEQAKALRNLIRAAETAEKQTPPNSVQP